MPACACTYVRTRTREGVQTRHAPKPSPWVFRVFCPGLPGFFGFSAAAGRPGPGFSAPRGWVFPGFPRPRPRFPGFSGLIRARFSGFPRQPGADPGSGAAQDHAVCAPAHPGVRALAPAASRPARAKRTGFSPRPGPGLCLRAARGSGSPVAAVRRVRRGFHTLPRESRPCSPQGVSNPHGSLSGDRRPGSRARRANHRWE